MAVGTWGIAPSEFMKMCPAEFWLVYDAKLPPKMYGRMSESEAEELLELMNEKGGEEWQQ